MKAAWPVALGAVALGTIALGAVACLMVPGIGLMLAEPPKGLGPEALMLAATMLAVFVAAAVSAVAGFAFSGLCGPLLHPLTADPARAVVIMAVSSLGIQLLMVWRLRRELELRRVLPSLAGGLATLPIGVHLLLHLPAGAYASALGACLLAYGCWMLLAPAPPPISPRLVTPGAVLAGAIGGVTGGLAAFPGAMVVIWYGLLGWPRTRQRAVFQPYILVMQVATLGLILAMAPGGSRLLGEAGPLPLGLVHLPPALLGATLGLRLFQRLSDRAFARTVNLLLIAAGAGLVL